MARKVVKDMNEDFLNCCICMSTFKTPKMLPCIHSFCEGCLEKYARKQNSDEIPCPTCRKVCKLPETGVKGLPTNFHLINLAERVALLEKLTSTQKSAAQCDSCKNPEIVAFCVDCNFAICSNCQRQHSLFPILRSHGVIPLTKLYDPKFQQEWKHVKSPYCELHSSEKLHFYCNTCSQLVCRDCTIVLHSKPDHEYVEASSKFANIKENLHALLEASKTQLGEGSALLHEGEMGYELMNKEKERVEKELDAHCKRNLVEIEGRYNDLKKQMLASITERAIPVNEQIDYAKNWIKRMQNTQEITQTVIEENNPWELLAMSTDLTAAFNELETDSKTIDLGPSALKHNISFFPTPIPDIHLGAWQLFPADTVCTDQTGNFFICEFNRSKRMMSIAKVAIKDYKLEPVDSYEWQDDFEKGAKLVACEAANKFVFVGYGNTIAKFDYLSKSYVSKTKTTIPGTLQCMLYNKAKQRIFVAGTSRNIRMFDINFTNGATYNIQAASPAASICPYNYDVVYYTEKDGMRRYNYQNNTNVSMPLPPTEHATATVTKLFQSSSDGKHTVFILQNVNKEDVKEDVKVKGVNDNLNAWMLQEYRIDLKKVIGVLECINVGIVKSPHSLISLNTADCVNLYLCDDFGKVTAYKRAVYKQDALKYERA